MRSVLHQKKHRKPFIFILILAAIIGIAFGVFIYLNSHPAKEFVKLTPQQTADKLLVKSQNGGAEQSVEALKKLANDETTKPSDKLIYSTALIRAYFDNNDPNSAAKQAVIVDADYPTANSAATAGFAYRDAGMFELAAKYFGLAAERSPKSSSATERTAYSGYLIEKKLAEAKIQ